LPELQVIRDGALRGFVSVNPRWAAFSADDYRAASRSVYNDLNELPIAGTEVEVQSGDFDLRGFEIARSQFFDTARKMCVTFSTENVVFSLDCVRKFDKALYIEVLVNPYEHLLVVRPCNKETKNAVRWALFNDDQYSPRNISCAAYIKTLYDLFGWKLDCKYRVRGIYRKKDSEAVLIFDMRETEIFIPQDTLGQGGEKMSGDFLPNDIQPFTAGPKKDIMAYPSSWADSFGNNFYRHAQARELAAFDRKGIWKISEEGQPFCDSGLNITSPEIVGNKIMQIISNMAQETTDNGE
jgi:hypothetical protein